MPAQNLAQTFNFGAHGVEHLAHRVNLDVAALITFKRESNRDVLGEAQERGLIRRVGRRLCGNSGKRLSERKSRALGKARDARLKSHRGRIGIAVVAKARHVAQHFQDALKFILMKSNQSGLKHDAFRMIRAPASTAASSETSTSASRARATRSRTTRTARMFARPAARDHLCARGRFFVHTLIARFEP